MTITPSHGTGLQFASGHEVQEHGENGTLYFAASSDDQQLANDLFDRLIMHSNWGSKGSTLLHDETRNEFFMLTLQESSKGFRTEPGVPNKTSLRFESLNPQGSFFEIPLSDQALEPARIGTKDQSRSPTLTVDDAGRLLHLADKAVRKGARLPDTVLSVKDQKEGGATRTLLTTANSIISDIWKKMQIDNFVNGPAPRIFFFNHAGENCWAKVSGTPEKSTLLVVGNEKNIRGKALFEPAAGRITFNGLHRNDIPPFLQTISQALKTVPNR